MAFGTLGIFQLYNPEFDLVYAQTMAFTTLMMFQMFNVLNQRSEEVSLFKLGVFSNRWLIGAIALSVILQITVVYLPVLNTIFGTMPLAAIDWLWVLLVSSTVLIFGEIMKLVLKW